MEFWSLIATVINGPLDQAGPMLARMPLGAAIVAAALPLAATLISRWLLSFLGVATLMLLALIVLLSPTAAPAITAISAYFACLVLAAASVQSWHNDRVAKAELAELRADIDRIRNAESRRFVMELNAPKSANTQAKENSSLPKVTDFDAASHKSGVLVDS